MRDKERTRQLAEQAGFVVWEGAIDWASNYDEELEKFAELVRAHEWVGLTDEEIKEIVGPWGPTPIKGYTRKLFDQIEAKLKEKNK